MKEVVGGCWLGGYFNLKLMLFLQFKVAYVQQDFLTDAQTAN